MPEALESLRKALEGRYRVERRIGEGGMAVVYLAHDERHRRPVAVKVLRSELAQSIGVDRFSREIEIAARLNHPHILPLLDSGTLSPEPGQPASAYYVMPYVEGESLRDRLRREGRLPMVEAVRFAREVAGALDYAHRHGVIHRDIKPENILLSEGHAVVADFGIARALDQAGATITQAGQALGSPGYMSPEQITGEAGVDGRTDLYALGCTLFEMLTGQTPWSGGSMSSTLARRLTEPAPRIRTVDARIPAGVDSALVRALAREPRDRFATPAEFAAALEDSVTGERAGLRRSTSRRMLGVSLGALIVVAGGVLLLTRLARKGHADAITSLAIAPEAADSATVYLSEGVLDAVANLLRRVPQLRVTAPSYVAQVRRQQPNINAEELGGRLKVGAILTWSLRRVGDSVHLAAELLRVPGGALVWSARYGRQFADVAALEGEIARMVSDSLRLQLTGEERATMKRKQTASGAAYDQFLQARRFEQRGVPLGARDARALMDSSAYYARAAIALDSSFAAPYGVLGTYYFVLAFRGWAPFAQYVDSALIASRKALASDSTLGDPWVTLASKAIYLDDDWDGARDVVHRALRLASYDLQVLQSSGIVLGEVDGLLDSAIVLLRRSVELEPSTPNLNTLGDLYMRTGRYDSAVVVLRSAFELDRSVPGPRRRLITSLEHLGRYAEAIEVRRRGGDSAGVAAYARGFQEGGGGGYDKVRREDLGRQLQAALAAASLPYRIPQDTVPQLREGKIAAIYAQLGEWTKAMDWVLKERERRPKRFRLYVANPDYRGLRNDPRFLSLVRAEGLSQLLPK